MSANRGKDYSGYLFVIEGIDGAGKTTVCDGVEQALLHNSFDVVRLREPTNESPWGKEIRRRTPHGELTGQEEFDLYIKDRDWHVKNRILPALQADKIVLMDRYFIAHAAYQSTSTNLSWREILRHNREEINAPEPDMIFLLDISAEVGLERVLYSREAKNEQFEQLDRLVKVRNNYLEMVQEDSGNYLVIDATQSIEFVEEQVVNTILGLLR
ncbi:MAG: dTMP kinase [Candidatus Thorarchaeota archaeon]|nr:dTMP kinase [Candidatus Thorarchaeota archaeon]